MEIPRSPEEKRMEKEQFLILWQLLVPAYGPGCASWEATGATGTQSPGQADLGGGESLLPGLCSSPQRQEREGPEGMSLWSERGSWVLNPEPLEVFKARLDRGSSGRCPCPWCRVEARWSLKLLPTQIIP